MEQGTLFLVGCWKLSSYDCGGSGSGERLRFGLESMGERKLDVE